MRYEGWLWRVGLVLLIEIVLSTDQAMFGRLALWAASFMALFVYQRAISRKVLFLLLAFMFVALPGLEQAKLRLREKTWWAGPTRITTPSSEWIFALKG